MNVTCPLLDGKRENVVREADDRRIFRSSCEIGGARLLFFLFLLALSTEGSARPQHMLAVGVFTATIGLLFLFCVQALAEWSQNVIIIPTSIVGLVFYIFWMIGFSLSKTFFTPSPIDCSTRRTSRTTREMPFGSSDAA